MEKKFFKVDLHVHTPASSCYIGNKDDEEYFSILENAKSNKIDAIAITDHNTICGYERFCSIRKELIIQHDLLNSFENKSEEILQRIENIETRLSVFKSVKIFLGVELTLNPGVHLIIIGDDDDISYFNSLLDRIGYNETARGLDSSLPTCDIRSFLDYSDTRDKIVIAPHIDSDKGIFSHLEGEYRAYIFSAENLNAVSCNSTKIAKRLEQDYLNQPQYKRKTPLSFINASDAHEAKSVGKKVSYIQMAKCTFANLKDALRTPGTSISDLPNPEVRDFVDKILDDKNSVIALPTIESLSKALCACLNKEYGYVVLGVVWPQKELIGINKTEGEFEEILSESQKKLISGSHCVLTSIEPYMLGTARTIFILTVQSISPSIWSEVDTNDVYLIDDDHGVRRATIGEIEARVQENLLTELYRIEQKQEIQIEKILTSLCLLKQSVTRGEICHKIKNSSLPLMALVQPSVIRKGQTSGYTFYSEQSEDLIGQIDGNTFVLYNQEARLEDAYLRCSCPCLGNIEVDVLNASHTAVQHGDSIIVAEKGGIHVIEKEEWYFCSEDSALILSEVNTEIISVRALLGWLKSSVFLFFLLQEEGNVNLFAQGEGFGISLVPNLNSKGMETQQKIEDRIAQIIDLEKEFLEKFRSLSNKQSSNHDVIEELIDQHNLAVQKIAVEIDHAFFEFFKLSQGQIKCIYETLTAEGVFNLNQ